MRFIDCECMVGESAEPLPHGVVANEADLLSEMDRLHIDKALVRHRLCLGCDARTGNSALVKEISENDRLVRVKMVLPEGERPDFDAAGAVAAMGEEGFGVAWICPSAGQNPYPLRRWCAGAMLSALEERRMPALIQLNSVEAHELYEVLCGYPRLPVILIGLPRLGRHRTIWSLAEECKNLYLCIGQKFAVLEGISQLCRTIGADRLVWGSGYPDAEGGAAVTNLMYSGVSRSEQEQIASGTIERLLSEVRGE